MIHYLLQRATNELFGTNQTSISSILQKFPEGPRVILICRRQGDDTNGVLRKTFVTMQGGLWMRDCGPVSYSQFMGHGKKEKNINLPLYIDGILHVKDGQVVGHAGNVSGRSENRSVWVLAKPWCTAPEAKPK